MFEITVKWPDGRVITQGGWERDVADLYADILWACGADDVKVTCTCGTCETCTDRAAWVWGD